MSKKSQKIAGVRIMVWRPVLKYRGDKSHPMILFLFLDFKSIWPRTIRIFWRKAKTFNENKRWLDKKNMTELETGLGRFREIKMGHLPFKKKWPFQQDLLFVSLQVSA